MKTNGYDYPFLLLGNNLTTPDITFGNLECPLSDRGSKLLNKSVCFRGDPEAAYYLKKYGFDVMSVANNHSLDYNEAAFLDTLDNLRQAGIQPVGGGEDITAARQPVIFDINGIKIGFLAYTNFADTYYYPRSFKATDTRCGVAPLDEDMMYEDVSTLSRMVDIVVVSLHWGTEYDSTPSSKQRRIAHNLIDRGADVIIGHHPHCIQGLEKYNNGLIAYSLGNFIFDQYTLKKTRYGLKLDLVLDKTGVVSARAVPVELKDCQTRIMQGSETQELLTEVARYCSKLGTSVLVQNSQLVIL